MLTSYLPISYPRYFFSIALLALFCSLGSPVHAENFKCQFIVASEWNSGLTANLRLTNESNAANEWHEITIRFPGVVVGLQNGWNGEFSGTDTIVIRPSPWNRILQANQSFEFGMQLTKPLGTSLPAPILGGDCADDNQPPIAALKVTNYLESLVHLDATQSSDPDGDELTYTWSINGNVSSGFGNYRSHVNLSKGNHIISVTVSDGQLSTTETVNFYMSYPQTHDPVAEFNYQIDGMAVTFDGSRSHAVGVFGVRINAYYWDFGDGATGTGVNASHTYAAPGVYPVTLRVYDSNMDTAAKIQTVIVGDVPNQPPVGVFTVSQNLHLVTLDARDSYDPDGNTLIYQWLIDGSPSLISGPYIENYPLNRGTQIITLTVSDGRLSHSVSETLVITHPEIPLASFEYESRGLSVAVDGSLSKALSSGSSIASYTWDFGDGTTGEGVTASHNYAAPGTYNLSLTVEDTFFVSATTTHQVTIGTSTNLPPEIDFSCKNATMVADAFDLGISTEHTLVICTNASTDPEGDALTFSGSWGDGSSIAPDAYFHSYRKSGIYTITLTASDGTHSVTESIQHTAIGNGFPPVVSLECEPDNFTVTCRASAEDPDAEPLKYRVRWGDGTIETLSSLESFSHTFASEDDYLVQFYAADTAHLIMTSQAVVVDSTVKVAPAECTYLVENNWGNTFQARIRVTNTSDAAIEGWAVNWGYSDGSRVSQLWNASMSGTNPYVATDMGWNARIQPGAYVEFGFQGTKASAKAEIAQVTGDICGE